VSTRLNGRDSAELYEHLRSYVQGNRLLAPFVRRTLGLALDNSYPDREALETPGSWSRLPTVAGPRLALGIRLPHRLHLPRPPMLSNVQHRERFLTSARRSVNPSLLD
jgi:hypothetical protein